MATFEEQASALFNNIPDVTKIVFFAGAGISVPSRYPLWKTGTSDCVTLAETRRLISPAALAYAREELAKDAYYGVFDILERQLTEAAYLGIAMEVFGKELRPSALHELMVGIPCRGVITTNFDECLAAAYAAKHGAIPISDMRLAMASDKFFVAKPHGSILNPKSMVLTTNGWRKVEESEDFKDLMANTISNSQLFFLGYGLKDPDFEHIWMELLAKRAFRSPAIYCCADGALTPARLEEFRAKNIHVASFADDGSYGFLLEVLKRFSVPRAHASRASGANPTLSIAQDLEKHVLLCMQFSPAHQDRLVLVAKAIALDTFGGAKGAGIGRREFLQHLYGILGQQSTMIENAGEKAIRELEDVHFLTRNGDLLFADSKMADALFEKTAEMETAEAAWVDRVLQELAETMGLKVRPEDRAHVLQVMDRAFLDVGRDLAELLLFNRLPKDESERADKSVDAVCLHSSFADRRDLYRRVLRRMLFEPSEAEEDLLFKRLQAYFITTAYILNPSSEKLLAQYAGNHWVYFDSSIVLLAMAMGHPSNAANKRLLQRTTALGMRPVIIRDMLNEVWHNVRSAMGALEAFNKAPTTLKDAVAAYVALYGSGNGNVFLEGFLNQLDLDPGLTPRGYMTSVLGLSDLPSTEDQLAAALSDSFGIEVDVLNADETVRAELDPIVDSIEALRTEGGRFKGRLLCEHEARMFYLVHLRRKQNPDWATKIWYVTTDRFVMKLQRLEESRFPLPISYTPRAWFQYLDLVDFESRGSHNFSRLHPKVRAGVFSGEIGIEAIRVIIQEQRDLLQKGAVALKELADVVVKDFHVKQAIADFENVATPNRQDEQQQAEARARLRQEVSKAAGQFIAVRKQELDRLKLELKEANEAKLKTERKLRKEEYVANNLKAQLRPRKKKKRRH